MLLVFFLTTERDLPTNSLSQQHEETAPLGIIIPAVERLASLFVSALRDATNSAWNNNPHCGAYETEEDSSPLCFYYFLLRSQQQHKTRHGINLCLVHESKQQQRCLLNPLSILAVDKNKFPSSMAEILTAKRDFCLNNSFLASFKTPCAKN